MNLFSPLMLVCGKINLYILMGIKLPSLPVSVLYLYLFLADFVVNFLIITDLMLRKLKFLYLTASNSCVAIFCLHHLSACNELLCVFCHFLASVCSSVFSCLYQFSFCLFLLIKFTVLLLLLFQSIKFFTFFCCLFQDSLGSLCLNSPWQCKYLPGHHFICLFDCCQLPYYVNHHIITMSLTNSSFSVLFFSLYPHSFASNLTLPIHSLAFSFCSLVNL